MTLGIVLLTHLLSTLGQTGAFLLASPSPSPVAQCGFGSIDQCFDWINNPVGFVVSNILQGPFSFIGWVLQHVMDGNNFYLNQSCPTGYSGQANCIYYRLWQVGYTVGIMVLVVAAATRALREMVGERARVNQAVIGTLVRLVLVFGLMTISYSVLAWASDASFTMYGGLYGAFASQNLSTLPASTPAQGFLNAAQGFSNLGWLALMYVLDFVGIIYVTWLILVARFVLLIGTAFAPVVIALSVYSEKTAIFIWWTRKMIGALLVPVFAGAVMGVVTAIVFNLNPQIISDPNNIWAPRDAASGLAGIVATVTFIGGCWFLGQAIKHTTGINLGAHSLSTMVAGGMGIMKLGGMAQAAFGMGAKGMDAIGGKMRGSSGEAAASTQSVQGQLVGGGLAAAPSGSSSQVNLTNQSPQAMQTFIDMKAQDESFVSQVVTAQGPEWTAAAIGDLPAGSKEANVAIVGKWAQTQEARPELTLQQLKSPLVNMA